VSYYRRHVFFCTNQRGPDADRPCCNDRGGSEMRAHAKARVKALGLAGPGGVRVNKAGCMDRCEEGPCCVVYPEGVWYTYVDEEDVDEIVDRHLKDGQVVERLLMPPRPRETS